MITDNESKETLKNMRRRTCRLEREGDYWTPDELERLIELFNSGTGISQIAILLQRTEPAVYQQIEKLDLYERKRNPQRAPKALKAPTCLCNDCNLDRSLCPRCERLTGQQEAV